MNRQNQKAMKLMNRTQHFHTQVEPQCITIVIMMMIVIAYVA